MKRPSRAGQLAIWVLTVLASIAGWWIGSQLGIPPVVWVVVFGLFAYFNFRINTLEERLAIWELPTIDELLGDDPAEPDQSMDSILPDQGWGINDETRAFHADFREFARLINGDLAESKWRLHSVADAEVSTIADDGPVYGRRFAILFGTRNCGRLSLSPGWKYSRDEPTVHAVLELTDARIVSGASLMDFCRVLISYLVDRDSRSEVQSLILGQMVEATWQLGPSVVSNADLDVEWTGQATRFLRELERGSADRTSFGAAT